MWRSVAVCVVLLLVTVAAGPVRRGERCDPVVQAAVQLYATLHPNTEINDTNPEYGEYLEGDILVRENTELQNESNPLNAVTDPDLLWPGGILYYTIVTNGYTSDQIGRIKAGIDDLVELTKVNGKICVQILPRDNEDDYVFVENDSGCSSYLGMIGGSQSISLVDACLDRHGTIMHEFLHAFGFDHEQQRADRDDWVTINWDNIEPGNEDWFGKRPEGDLFGTSYDYGSVMHYGAYAFAVDPDIPTIIPHDPNAKIGQRVTLSELDIERVQILYGCLAAADSRFFKNMDPKWIPRRN